MISCPKCGKDTTCYESRTGGNLNDGGTYTRRRRECTDMKACKYRFTTVEVPVSGRNAADIAVVYRDELEGVFSLVGAMVAGWRGDSRTLDFLMKELTKKANG